MVQVLKASGKHFLPQIILEAQGYSKAIGQTTFGARLLLSQTLSGGSALSAVTQPYTPHRYPPQKEKPRRSSAETNRSMIPFIRIARFQSFSVDLPAKWTNSLGLIR